MTLFLMSRACRLDPDSRWNGVSLVFGDDSVLRDLGRRCGAGQYATDVLSFRFAPLPGERDGAFGEIVVNVECALRLGREGSAWSPSRELALYIAHGCDHLCGGTDDTAAGRARMRRRELRWLRQAEGLGLLKGLFQ
jgi:rRNA maturation RNase YbeY